MQESFSEGCKGTGYEYPGRIIHRGTSFQVHKEFPLISPPRLCRLKTHGVFAVADENRSSRHIPKVGIPSQTIRIPKGWAERGETTIQTTFKQPTGGVTEKKDQPEWRTDRRSADFSRDFFSTHFDINYLPENQARTEALWETSENGGRAACDGERRVTFVARFCWSRATVFSRGERVETRTLLCRSVEGQILSVSDVWILRQQ